MNEDQLPELLTPRQTAKLLQTSVAVLAVWRSQKRVDLPYIKIGRSVRYELSDVKRFLESHKVKRVQPDSHLLGVV